MDNSWAILVGINQYQHLQPLMYAQPDAQSLRNFLVDEAGVEATQCVLLGDGSTPIADQPTTPTKTAIQGWLTHFCKTQVQPGDKLWFVFVGYGLCANGADYLMPIEGDPNRMAETAIALADIYSILSAAPTDNVLVLLDMNRSAGRQTEAPIGKQALSLAEQYDIATILSCQPEQNSYETVALRSGLFMAALLEGLRYQGCVTPGQLYTYLSDRLPELSQHHWRPDQTTPIALIPVAKRHEFIVPTALIGKPSLGYEPLPGEASLLGDEVEGTTPPDDSEAEAAALIHLPSAAEEEEGAAGRWDGLWRWGAILGLLVLAMIMARTFVWTEPVPVSDVNGGTPPADENDDGAATGGDPVGAGGAEVTRPESGSESGADSGAAGTVPDDPDATTSPTGTSSPDENSAEDGLANLGEPGAGTSAGGTPTNPTGTPPPPSPSDPGTNPANPDPQGLNRFNPFNSGDRDGAGDLGADPVAPAVAIQNARQALAARQLEAAKTWLDQVPESQRDESYNTLATEVDRQRQAALASNQAMLEAAKIPIRPTQASSFNQAIETARRIPAGQPLYAEAQANIDRWSQVILDLAVGRAAQGNLESAIAAASLVPEDRPQLHAQAQAKITEWQHRLDDRARISAAISLIRPTQAHTYQWGIIRLQRLQSTNSPEQLRAQQLINQWSQNILNIARDRAAQGNYASAIQAANLVPETTTAFSQAQAEIQRWRGRS